MSVCVRVAGSCRLGRSAAAEAGVSRLSAGLISPATGWLVSSAPAGSRGLCTPTRRAAVTHGAPTRPRTTQNHSQGLSTVYHGPDSATAQFTMPLTRPGCGPDAARLRCWPADAVSVRPLARPALPVLVFTFRSCCKSGAHSNAPHCRISGEPTITLFLAFLSPATI